MSSTSPPPPLSARERLVLETMVHHECRHDPGFVDRLTGWSPAATLVGRAPRRPPELAMVVAVLGAFVVLGVLVGLAAAGLVGLVAGLVLVVAPVVLAVRALRRSPRSSR